MAQKGVSRTTIAAVESLMYPGVKAAPQPRRGGGGARESQSTMRTTRCASPVFYLLSL